MLEVFYMNDTKTPMTVRVVNKSTNSFNGQKKFLMNEVTVLQPQQSKIFEVDAPVGTIPFIKSWEGIVLITYIDPDRAVEN